MIKEIGCGIGIAVFLSWAFLVLSFFPVAYFTGKTRTWVYWGRVDSKRIDGVWWAVDENEQPLTIDLSDRYDALDDIPAVKSESEEEESDTCGDDGICRTGPGATFWYD